MWAAHAERQLLPQKERLQRTVAALSSKSSCSYESDFADLTTPSARTKVASRYFLDRVFPSFARRGIRSSPIHSHPRRPPLTVPRRRCPGDISKLLPA